MADKEVIPVEYVVEQRNKNQVDIGNDKNP